jgi:Chaperone of endosialidase
MASTINASSTGSGGLISTADASGVLQLQNNGTTAVTVTGGNVGIGTSSPVSVGGYTSLTLNNATSGGLLYMQNGGVSNTQIAGTSTFAGISTLIATPIIFATNNTEAIRITSAGNVGIGTSVPGTQLGVGTGTDQAQLGISGAKSILYLGSPNNGSGGQATLYYDRSTGNIYLGQSTPGGALGTAFGIDVYGNARLGYTGSGGSNVRLLVFGSDSSSSNYSIYAQNSSATPQFGLRNDNYLYCPAIGNYSVAGTTVVIDGSNYIGKLTSSLRYKKDIVDYNKGIETIVKLRPVYYKSKIEGPNGFDEKQHAGFIAEEIADAGLEEFLIRNEEGSPDAIQYSQMTAILCKAIQEQQALIESLTTRLTALEAK